MSDPAIWPGHRQKSGSEPGAACAHTAGTKTPTAAGLTDTAVKARNTTGLQAATRVGYSQGCKSLPGPLLAMLPVFEAHSWAMSRELG